MTRKRFATLGVMLAAMALTSACHHWGYHHRHHRPHHPGHHGPKHPGTHGPHHPGPHHRGPGRRGHHRTEAPAIYTVDGTLPA